MHEASLSEENSFVTLTYDDSHVGAGLNYGEFQRFMKRLRKLKGPCRFFMCGEYGELRNRPHFHALLFGVGFRDRVACGKRLYRSAELESLWPFGFSSIGDVTHESAGYVARYSLKKVVGARARFHYQRVDLRSGEILSVVPEFAHMSLRPGIGYRWFEKYWREVLSARDGVVLPGGFELPVPRYYDRLLEQSDPDLRDWREYTRYVRSSRFVEDCSPERLAVREQVLLGRLNFMTRRVL